MACAQSGSRRWPPFSSQWACAIRDRVVDSNRATDAHSLVQQLLKADTAQLPENILALASFRQWADPELKEAAQDEAGGFEGQAAREPGTAAGDRAQAEYVYDRLLAASPAELPVIWGILREHDRRSGAAALEAAGRSGG